MTCTTILAVKLFKPFYTTAIFSVVFRELHDFFQGCRQTTYLMVLTLPASAALAQRRAWVSASHHSRMSPATTVITCSMLSAKVCVGGVVGGGVGGGLVYRHTYQCHVRM